MPGLLKDCVHLILQSCINNPDFFNKLPRKGIVNQKFGLFSFLDQWITKVSRLNSIPGDLIQSSTTIIKISKLGSGVSI